MFTKNINFSNFKFKSNLSKKKNLLKKINNKNIFIELPLLRSLTKDYQMGYDRSLIKSLKNYKKINLIGMGGSILGTQAIYDFFKQNVEIYKEIEIFKIFPHYFFLIPGPPGAF